MSIARQLALGGLVLTLLLSGRAEAQSDEARARDLFQEGVALAKEERWSDALAKFEESRALFERPSTVFNIGTTLVHLERHKAAIETFEQFLALADRAEQRKAAEDLIAQSRASLVVIDLTIEPRSATLLIDGESIPANGPVRHLELDPGQRTFEIAAEGFGSVTETMALSPGDRLIRSISLQPIAPPPPPVAIAPPVPADTPPVAMTPAVETTPEEGGSILESPWFWVIAGVVVVGAAVGVGVAVGTRKVEDPVGGTSMSVIEP